MRKISGCVSVVCLLAMLSPGARGVSADPAAPAASGAPAVSSKGLSGRWVVSVDFFGTPQYFKLQLTQQGDALTGDLDGDKLEGDRKSTRLNSSHVSES